MTQHETEAFRVIGFHHLGGGYDSDAYILAGIIINALGTLKYHSGEYPEPLQDMMHKLESYALAKDEEINRNRARAEESFYNGDSFFLAEFAGSHKVYSIFRKADLHRLSPNFQSSSLNQAIRNARTEYAAKYPPKPKGFWASLFG
ncbi:MAG: hypothetical protein II649_04370 [Kiritimatiellae bacterium]|nr:hypothetical protein [Kiritimatiellia bacterium]